MGWWGLRNSQKYMDPSHPPTHFYFLLSVSLSLYPSSLCITVPLVPAFSACPCLPVLPCPYYLPAFLLSFFTASMCSAFLSQPPPLLPSNPLSQYTALLRPCHFAAGSLPHYVPVTLPLCPCFTTSLSPCPCDPASLRPCHLTPVSLPYYVPVTLPLCPCLTTSLSPYPCVSASLRPCHHCPV